jgi:alkanesulfonate monooxygenase SsuD/methylene tetrahydromethanopterin reductase-like flavin-dependent oxidoreductase (luciferase family)
MIKPWLFEFFHAEHDPARRDDPKVVQQRYADYFDIWVNDEALDFEGIFFSEHHFGPGYSPSPNIVVSHLAARTTTLRLGVLGTVSAYGTPWRVAEEYAMLDHLTGGRLEMGVVSGIPPEQGVVGIIPPQAAAIHAETLDVLQAAISKPVVSHQGEYFSFDDVRLTPSFLQESPSVWTAATSEASARRAGQRGLKLCVGFKNVDQLVPLLDAYREGAASSGQPATADHLGVRRQIVLVDDASKVEDARQLARDGIQELFSFSAEAMKIPDAHEMPIDPDEVIAGTPDQVAGEIIRQCTELGAGNFLASFNIFDTATLRRAHEMFGRDVIPQLRAADIGTAT